MKLADIALVGDLFTIIPALEAELVRLGVARD
jgi:electron transfer flavoprotein alpha subunit